MSSKIAPQTEATTVVSFQAGLKICFVAAGAAFVMAAFGYVLYVAISGSEANVSPEVYVSGVSLSSFGVLPSSGRLNGTWCIDFSLLRKTTLWFDSSYDSAVVTVYNRGAYLAGANLHAFRIPRKHPMQLEVLVDASRSGVPGWLADDLMEDRRRGAVEFDVQFVAKNDVKRVIYLCDGLRLGFSMAEEANLIGDGHVRCPLIAERDYEEV